MPTIRCNSLQYLINNIMSPLKCLISAHLYFYCVAVVRVSLLFYWDFDSKCWPFGAANNQYKRQPAGHYIRLKDVRQMEQHMDQHRHWSTPDKRNNDCSYHKSPPDKLGVLNIRSMIIINTYRCQLHFKGENFICNILEGFSSARFQQHRSQLFQIVDIRW